MKILISLLRIFLCLLPIIFLPSVKAQLCSGSLGDAVVNMTFGSGAGPGSSLPGATTSYSFTPSICPDDGSYTVVTSISGCFQNSWHTLFEDHTAGDVNGYMMLINASFNPGDFYLDTVKNLCAGTAYEFGAWITNVILQTSCGGSATKPQLTFKIETTSGIILGSYNTGDIAATNSPTWKQYGFFFTTPVNNSTVVIRITNNAPGGCGNDLAVDDITFKPCGPIVSAKFATDTIIHFCMGKVSPVTIFATVGPGYSNPVYQWQLNNNGRWVDIAGATSLTYIHNEVATGVYKYRLAVANGNNINLSNCRVQSNVATVAIHDGAVASASNTGPVCENSLVHLSASGGSFYQWTGPAGFTSTEKDPAFIATNISGGQYMVTVKDTFGCEASASTLLTTLSKPSASVSSAQSICNGDVIELQATGGMTYRWLPTNGLSDPQISNPIASPVTTTTYNVIVTANNNCTDTGLVTVTVRPTPVVNSGDDKSIIKGQSIRLNGSINALGDVNYNWLSSPSLNDPSVLTPIANPVTNTIYILTATSTVGCGSSVDSVLVKVYNDLYIPNAFSPNGDKTNDTWHIESLAAFPNAVISIYNRYGNKVFESNAVNKDWDGTWKNSAQAAGAYAYMIDLKNNAPIKKGMVIIVR
jgi:gliding motility-associated-like protein